MDNIEKIADIVKEKLKCSAHDLDHVFRVYANAINIAESEKNVDMDILRISALLHDIARVEEDQCSDGSIDHAILGASQAEEILQRLGYDEKFISHVSDVIKTHRYRNGNTPQTLEAKILFDADKIDVLGCIGICRSYMIAGEYGQKIYNLQNLDEYIKENLVDGVPTGRIIDISKHSPNIEFELKCKKITDRLFTEKGKKIAEIRIQKMKNFYDELKIEIEGNEHI